MEVESFQELLQGFAFLLELDEELLRVAARLRARARANMLLHMLPLLAEQLEGLQEAEVLIARPPPRLGASFFLHALGRLLGDEFGGDTFAEERARDRGPRCLGLRQASWACVPLRFIGVVTLSG